MNTIEQHKNQITKALNFLAKAKFTSAAHLQTIAERKRRGLPTQLKNLGLIVSREFLPGMQIHGLSQKGANLVGVPKFDIHKVGIARVEHALVAQSVTLNSLKDYDIIDFEFEPQTRSQDTRPDIVWKCGNGCNSEVLYTWHVEIELSPKSIADGEMDRFFLKVIKHPTILVFKEGSLLARYIKQADHYANNGIPDWKRQDGEWFKTGGKIHVDRPTWSQVYFREYDCAGMSSFNEFRDENLMGYAGCIES